MKRFITTICSLILIISVHAQELETIIDRHIEAMGGYHQLSKLESVVKEGYVDGTNKAVTIQCIQQEAGGYKQTLMAAGIKDFLIVTPKAGWYYNPARADGLYDLDLNTVKNLAHLMKIKGMLVDHHKNGMKVTNEGLAMFDGESLIQLKCIDSCGIENLLFLDPISFLIKKEISRLLIDGQLKETLIGFSDYKSVEGVMVAFEMDLPLGRVRFQKIEFNKELDEREFMPFKN